MAYWETRNAGWPLLRLCGGRRGVACRILEQRPGLGAELNASYEKVGEDWASWRLHPGDQAVVDLEGRHPL